VADEPVDLRSEPLTAEDHLRRIREWVGTPLREYIDNALASLARSATPSSKEAEPLYLACGCLDGAHENSMAGIKAAHPDIIVPTGFTGPFYGVATPDNAGRSSIDDQVIYDAWIEAGKVEANTSWETAVARGRRFLARLSESTGSEGPR